MSSTPRPAPFPPDPAVPAEILDTGGLGGHPRGLTTLFFTELWERFSYYGMRALLVYFMVAGAEEGGLGYPQKTATSIYGNYTMAVYMLSILGGYIADNFIGSRAAVLYGAIIIACGDPAASEARIITPALVHACTKSTVATRATMEPSPVSGT